MYSERTRPAPATVQAMPKRAVDQKLATLIDAVDELQEALRQYKRGLSRFGVLIQGGASVAEALAAIEGNVGGKPRLVPDTLDDFEAARNDFRTAIVTLALRQGTSAASIARRLGVSRQLVSRIALEAE
jgi:hypothetical protein